MRLTPWEEERLLTFSAAELARRHRAAVDPSEVLAGVAALVDQVALEVEPVADLPLNRRYFLR